MKRFAHISDLHIGRSAETNQNAAMLCATLLFFRPTLGHLTKVAAHRSCIGASDLCAAAAERLAVKQQLKALLRRRIGASGVPL